MKRLGLGVAALLLAMACVASVFAAPAPSDSGNKAASGVYYEIFVRSWYDTNGDGIGDLNGVTAKLDYLQSLGVSGIWLMPINPSPSYHGYDVTDYRAINPQYGTMADFERLVREAHRRGIKVIIDMVINHSSNRNPWFKASLDPKSPYRDWYTWAGKYTNLATPSAFGFKAWHKSADGQYYLSIFSPSMPDLNYDNPAVRQKMIDIGRFWLKQGVDGFRLDAAQQIYENFAPDMDDPEALAKNIAWWTQYRHGLEAVNRRVYLVGEVPIQLVQGIYPAGAAKSNRYPVGEVTRPKATELAPYLKPLDAVFNFPLAEQLIDAAISERNLAVAATLENAYAIYRKACGCDAIHDAPFLSNHDEIRLMSQFDGNIQHMRMAAAMLMTLPGEPYIYYGEELGMRGKKHPDAGVRTPMRWKRSLHAPGEATWYAKNSKNGAAISVEAERDDPHSLLNYYITLIHWRMAIPALRKGGWSVFPHAQDHLAVWQRTLPGRTVLVVHNLSKEAQTMPLDVPNEPHFTHLLKATHSGATIHGYTLRVPAYTSVVLQ